MSAYRWPAEHETRLREICSEPVTPSGFNISKRLNLEFGLALTYRSVIRKMVLLGLARSRVDVTDAWIGERPARLKTLYDRPDAPSYHVMAKELNAEFGTAFTRCAIASKISREGFANRSLLGLNRAVAPRKIVAKIPRPRRAPAPQPELVVVPLGPARHGIRITDLERGECRWPVESIGDQHEFCGHVQHSLVANDGSVKRLSYCRHHYEIGRGKGTASERAALRGSAAA